jgi:hypothetical protein
MAMEQPAINNPEIENQMARPISKTLTRSVNKAMNFPTIFRKPVRVTITLPHNTYLHLKNRSDEEGRSLSNLAAFLIETSLE